MTTKGNASPNAKKGHCSEGSKFFNVDPRTQRVEMIEISNDFQVF